jgi:hypothetical protein
VLVFVNVGGSVPVGVRVAVNVRVGDGVFVFVSVAVAVGVLLGVRVGVFVWVGVFVGGAATPQLGMTMYATTRGPTSGGFGNGVTPSTWVNPGCLMTQEPVQVVGTLIVQGETEQVPDAIGVESQ